MKEGANYVDHRRWFLYPTCSLARSDPKQQVSVSMRNFLLASLMCSAGTMGAQNGWQHVGLTGISPTTGVQFTNGELIFHPSGNLGRLYHTNDAGQNWDSTQFNATGRSWKYAVHGEHEYLSFYNGYSGGTRLFRFNTNSGQWQQKYLSVNDYEVLSSGRLVILSGVSGEKFPIRVSDDLGETWTTTFRSSGAFRFRYLGLDADQRLLVQTYDWDGATNDSLGLWRSADAGNTWSRINAIQYDLTDASITNDGHIYCSNGQRILHSSDHGVTWDEPWNVDFPYNGFGQSTVHHVGNGHLYFMRQAVQWDDPYHMYHSADGGQTWAPVTDEVSDHLAFNMAQDEQGNLFVATQNGVYRQELPTTIGEADLATRATIYPNPAQREVRLDVPGANVLAIRLMDAQGRVLRSFGRGGAFRTISLVGLAPATYVLEVITDHGTTISRLLVE